MRSLRSMRGVCLTGRRRNSDIMPENVRALAIYCPHPSAHYLSVRYPIPSQKAGSTLVTWDYDCPWAAVTTYSDDPHAPLPLRNNIYKKRTKNITSWTS
ncbi:hypothetical protein EVAR_18305_1 [Eumeta japonica]|uniref:Uncharacterized protein n=1 Tax=Eumeta variegata TaxID=151549 RepID=A0A4C1V9G7_EUMVA|nr:hypothetical protein EVAR_18305_1 [Eumeta japonica]